MATLLVFAPELRTFPMRVALGILWVTAAGSSFWRLHKAGVLTSTPKQIFGMASIPKLSMLELAAVLLGGAAIIATTP